MRQWVNNERTVLVTQWDNGTIQVATRETPEHTWEPPVQVDPEEHWSEQEISNSVKRDF